VFIDLSVYVLIQVKYKHNKNYKR